MSKIIHTIRQFFTPNLPLPSGMYHYISPANDPRNYRLHLRLEPDGSGILIVNASSVLHLNQTAAEYAYYLVNNEPMEQVASKMAMRYSVNKEQAWQDYQKIADRIQTMINTPDLDPETFLDFDRQAPFSRYISAPYRLDCALTYKMAGTGEIPLSLLERAKEELSTDSWKAIIDKGRSIGIPHIVFTGGEPTLRNDLPELVGHAETNEMVTGLITSGFKLDDPDYLSDLLLKGLDHLMLVLDTGREQHWEALENALAGDIFVAVHITINPDNLPEVYSLIKELKQHGVPAISLSVTDPQREGDLRQVRDWVASQGMELVWNLPVPYSLLHPVALEIEQPEYRQGAGRAWLYIEPDGDVLPAQGINQVLGNMYTDPWEKIWRKR